MPSVQDLLKAYSESPGSPFPPQSARGEGTGGLAFVPPLHGLIRPTSAASPTNQLQGGAPSAVADSIEFTLYPLCIAWVLIPSGLIESIELLGKRTCRGSTYDYAKLTLRLPASPEEKFYAGLLAQKGEGECSCNTDDPALAASPAATSATVTKLRSECVDITVSNGQVCLRVPYAGDICISVPDWVPNGTVARACIDVCRRLGIPCGVEVYVEALGQRVASQSWGCC